MSEYSLQKGVDYIVIIPAMTDYVNRKMSGMAVLIDKELCCGRNTGLEF